MCVWKGGSLKLGDFFKNNRYATFGNNKNNPQQWHLTLNNMISRINLELLPLKSTVKTNLTVKVGLEKKTVKPADSSPFIP